MITDGNGNLTWTSNPSEFQNLEDVLILGNWTGTYSIEMGTGSSIYSARGGGQINLDYAPDSVVISTDNGNLAKAYIQLDDEDIIIDTNVNLNIGAGTASVVIQNGEGLVYGFDYSSTFVTYSLIDKNYVDSQILLTTTKYSSVTSFTASVTQTITHNLGTSEIIVQTYDSSGVMIIGDVSITDSNSVSIRFSQTLSNVKTVIIG
jgi:hypothetical protein